MLQLMYNLTQSDPLPFVLIVVLCAVGFALLIHAIRIIVISERAKQISECAMEQALRGRYKSGLTPAELNELAAERWQD